MEPPKIGSLRHNFAERSKDRLLPRKGFSENGADDGFDYDGAGGGGGLLSRGFRTVSDGFVNCRNWMYEVVAVLWEMGRDDPRKVVFAGKMALALELVSMVMEFLDSQYSIWAILTVFVVFEFSVEYRQEGLESRNYLL